MPAGFAVNPNVAVVLPMMCHADEADGDRARHRRRPLLRLLARPLLRLRATTSPGVTDVWDEFEDNRAREGLRARDRHRRRRAARRPADAAGARLAARRDRHAGPDPRPGAALRGGRRRPDDLRAPGGAQPPRAHLREPRAVRQRGDARVRRTGRAAREGARRAPRRRDRGGAGAARPAPPGAPRATRSTSRPSSSALAARGAGRSGLRERAAAAAARSSSSTPRARAARASHGSSAARPEQLERRFGNRVAQRVIFGGMARQFVPD